MRRRCLIAVACTLAILPQASVNAANILFVINTVIDPTTATLGQDQEVRDRLVSKGHTVTLADDQDPLLGDLIPGKDLVLISSSTGSGNQPLNALSLGTLRSGRIPIISCEPGLYDEFLFQIENVFGNANGHTSLAISTANQSHPLAAGKSGMIEIVDPGNGATVSSSALPYTVGTNAILIASIATNAPAVDVGRICVWAYEKGSRLADNNTIASSRRMAFFMNATTAPGVYNADALALFDAAITWALAPPPNLPIIVAWRSPTSANAAPMALISAELEDSSTSQVNTNAITLSLNGAAVARTIAQNGAITTVSFQPTTILPAGSTNIATVVYQNKDTPPASFTNRFQFVVANYATIPVSLAYPVGSGDASAPGFRARVAQATMTPTLPNSADRAESQLAGTLIDPATGQPYVNEANKTGAGADGFFVDPNVINWSQDALGVAAEVGNFRDPAFPDEPIPGIPGIDGFNTDNIAAEVLAYLDLTAGVHTFGVNSDDGFVLAVGVEARDVLRIPLGRFDGGRGSADSTFTFVVVTNGVYSFRLIWYEGNGGANLELFSVDAATGARILVNDRTNSKAIKASRQLTVPTRPFVSAISPSPDAVRVPVDSAIDFTITNGAATVNTNTIQVRLDGQLVPLNSVTASANTVRVVADPAGNLAGTKEYRVQISFTDSAGAASSSESRFTTIRPPITAPPILQSAAGLAVIEAENFDTNAPQGVHTWTFDRTPAGYSGEGTMYALPDAPGAVIDQPNTLTTSPRLDYKVSFVKTGLHYFWFRGADGGGNSINAGIDGDTPGDTMNNIDQGCCGTRLVPGGVNYTWVGGIDGTPEGRSQFEITTLGVHTINVWMREDGQIVDKILITTDPAFTPTGAGPEQSGRVGQVPPTISITSPTANQTLPANSNITITVNAADSDGTVAKVEFFADNNLIGESTTAPFSITWTNVPNGRYVLSARATDNTGVNTRSATVEIVVGVPPPEVLFVHGGTATASDLALIARLRELGYVVRALVDAASQTSDASNKALIVVSSTVGSANVATKFTAAPVPLINWESAVYDDLGMELNNVNGATIATQTTIEILDASHPLAGGIGTGIKTVYTVAGDISTLTDVVPSAKVVARATDGTARPVLFGVEKGAAMNSARIATAPERRVGIFLANDTYVGATADGKKLFDAAVSWVTGGGTQGQQPKFNAPTLSANGVTISWTGTGTLEQTDSLSPLNWTTAPSQTNPQTVPATGTRFYRIRQ